MFVLTTAADAARSEYNAADSKYRNVDTEIGFVFLLLLICKDIDELN